MNLDVFDGMKGKLTQAHIDKGVRDMCRECPVALSISDMVAGHKRAGRFGYTQATMKCHSW